MEDETNAIRATIQLYFDGLYEGDTTKLGRAFHPSARLYWVDGGSVRELSRADWFTIVENRATPRASGLRRTDRIVDVDVAHATAAVAKVECSIHPRYFVDYLTLLNTAEGGWQIVAKASRTVVREGTC